MLQAHRGAAEVAEVFFQKKSFLRALRASAVCLKRVASCSLRGSEQHREAGVEGGDARQVRVGVARGGLGQVVVLLVRGGKEVPAYFGAKTKRMAEVEAEPAAHLADALHRVALLIILASAGA